MRPKNWMGYCPPCPPASYAPYLITSWKKNTEFLSPIKFVNFLFVVQMVSLISYDMYGDNIPKGRWSLAPTLCKTVKRETKVISFVVFQLPWETFIGREVSSIRALSGMEKKMVWWHGLFAFVKWLLTFVTFLIWML